MQSSERIGEAFTSPCLPAPHDFPQQPPQLPSILRTPNPHMPPGERGAWHGDDTETAVSHIATAHTYQQNPHASSSEALAGWSIERRTRHSCDGGALLQSPPLQLHDWETYGHAGAQRASPSFGRGGGGGRGQSLPASLWRHSGLLDGLASGDTGHRSIAPERYSTRVGALNASTGEACEANSHAAGGPGAYRFLFGGTSPRLQEVPLGRPTMMLGGGTAQDRGSDFWPTVRPTTLLPPGGSNGGGGGMGYLSSPEAPAVPAQPSRAPTDNAYPFTRPLPVDAGDEMYYHQHHHSNNNEDATMAYGLLPGMARSGVEPAGGNSPCGPLDGCTQVWPSSGQSPQDAPADAPWHTLTTAPTATTTTTATESNRLGSPPRVSAGGSLSLACSRPQSCVLRSCSVNDLPWPHRGEAASATIAESLAFAPFEATCAAPPLNFATDADGYGFPTATTTTTMGVTSANNGATTEWIDELTQNNMDFAEIAELDHAPRKSYRHCDEGTTTTTTAVQDENTTALAQSAPPTSHLGETAYIQLPGTCSAPPPPTSLPRDASCGSSAHLCATRRIADAYTTEDEDDEEGNHALLGGPSVEAMLLPDPQRLVQGTVQSPNWPQPSLLTSEEDQLGVEAMNGAVWPHTDQNDGNARTISRREAALQHQTTCYQADMNSQAVPTLPLSDGDGGYMSSIGVVDETQISLDLGAQLAGIRVQASPTHKRLAFEEALDEDDPLTQRQATEGEDRLSASAAVRTMASSPRFFDPLNTSFSSLSATRHGSTNPASPFCLSDTMTPEEYAPNVEGVWAARRGTRRYTLRQGSGMGGGGGPSGGASRGQRGGSSGLSLLHSRKRCLDEMNGLVGGTDALDGFFTVMVTADSGGTGGGVATAEGESALLAALEAEQLQQQQQHEHQQHGRSGQSTEATRTAVVHKKYRLERLAGPPVAVQHVPDNWSTAVLCDRSPNVLFHTSPSHKCNEELTTTTTTIADTQRAYEMNRAAVHSTQ